MADCNFAGGATRSSDADHLDFLSLPLVGILALAKNAGVGGEKYGRFNYMLGMPAHVGVNHAFRHLFLWAMGDRSEAHLIRAAWNCCMAEQAMVLNPSAQAEHLPGPGYTVTPEIQAKLDANKDRLRELRDSGHFAEKEAWTTELIPEIQKLLSERNPIPPEQQAMITEVEQLIKTMSQGIGFEDPACTYDVQSAGGG